MVLIAGCLFQFVAVQSTAKTPQVPNILWLTCEDTGPEIGCYGDTQADTPNIDQLAARGTRYLNCWSNAPVCAPARTTIITGMYPTSLSAQHMRSAVRLPPSIKLIPQYLRESGYYCTNNSKEDYNLEASSDVWNESNNRAHWRKRKAGQPFFAVFNFTVSHESQIRKRPHKLIHDPAEIKIPPYHPDTPEVRQDWAQYYDKVTEMDQQVGRILEDLKQDGLEEETIIFFFGDHGSGMPRSKRWLYQSGLRVPLVIYVPAKFREWAGENYQPESVTDQCVAFVDLLPTLLSLTGHPIPDHLQGRAFLGKQATDQSELLYGFRDRMDERIDMSRTVRDRRYHYIRNFHPHRPQGAYLDYMFQTPTTQVWKRLFDQGVLNDTQSAFWKEKPVEELYDLDSDPYELNNLVVLETAQPILDRFRGAMKDWMLNVRDLGLIPEGEVLERAGRESPYSFGHQMDPQNFGKIYAAADAASRFDQAGLEQILDFRSSMDPAVRYWAATGLLIRAHFDREREGCVKEARTMANDPSPYVRAAIAELLFRWGNNYDRQSALHSLTQLANAKQSGLFAAIAALNHLDWCNVSRESGVDFGNLPVKVSGFPDRYDSYLPRLIERISREENRN